MTTGNETAPDRYPYGSTNRFHLQHVHLFASDLDASIEFYRRWFDGEVVWDGEFAGVRNVFMKIGIGALHFYEQPPRDRGRSAVNHLGIQVVGLEDLYARMEAAGLHMGKPIRDGGGSRYFMFEAPDGVLLELFEPGTGPAAVIHDYFGIPD
ncbi:VOC family protein [Mycobacterium sp. M1]|uniref:VOC family protein n=1 Tax=Mycolicibacter acidiphilus TaxID=2835306 RepID=A0ABS5RP97_9MYCO|nr:VOC family protein [Mycolicibacter acidiphilus]MBS9536110.1 VOC family protein [Mycolicibacter acidiphilus]